VRILHATERQHLDGCLRSENKGGNGFCCASRKLLSVRALSQPQFACRGPFRVVHLLPYSRWFTRTNPKARSNLHTKDAYIFPRYYIRYTTRTVGASCLQCWSAIQRAAISKHRYGVIGLTWRSRSAASDGRKIVLITLPLKDSRSRLAPNPTDPPSRGLPSRYLSFRSWIICTSICTEKKIAPLHNRLFTPKKTFV